MPPKKKVKMTHDTEELEILGMHKDCWTNVVDFLTQYELISLASTNKQFNTLVSPYMSLIKEFVHGRAKLFDISEDILEQNEDEGTVESVKEDQISEETVVLCEVENEDEGDADDSLGAVSYKEVNGAPCLRDFDHGSNDPLHWTSTPEDSEIIPVYKPILDKLGHIIREGDVAKPSNCDYRNEGKMIAHNGNFYSFCHNLGDDYGIIPSFYGLDRFPIMYFSQVVDHNHARIFRVNKDNFVPCGTEEDLEKCQERHSDAACEEVCKHVFHYYVRVTYKSAQFNLRYKFLMEYVEEPFYDYVMGVAFDNFNIC
jgi:hypothetical protein